MREVDSSKINCIWSNQEVGWYNNNALGQSGGIITMWNLESINTIFFPFKGEGFLGLKLICKNEVYYAVNVYLTCDLSSKRKLWSELLALKRFKIDLEE